MIIIVFIMKQTQSVFYPIPHQIYQSKIFKKREKVLNRAKAKTQGCQISPTRQQSSTLPIHDNYKNMKRQLQIYIEKQKNQILTQSSYTLPLNKSKLIFRNKKRCSFNETFHSVLSIPSEEMKISFTQNLLKNNEKKVSLSALKNCAYLSKTNYMKDINKYRDEGEIIGEKPREGAQQTSMKINHQESISIFRNISKSVKERKQRRYCQLQKRQASGGDNIEVVLVCKSFKSMEIQQLQKKKCELLKISQTLKFRNKKMLKIKKKKEVSKKEQIAPWSKSQYFEELQQTNCSNILI